MAAFERYGVKTGDKATYLHGPLPIQAQWNIGSFTIERCECSKITRFQRARSLAMR